MKRSIFCCLIILLFLKAGNIQAQITFEKTLGYSLLEQWGYSTQQTTDGGYIVVGYTGTGDVYLIKTNEYGTDLWEQNIGGTAMDRGFSVRQTTDGGYIIAGYTESFGAGLADVYLIKTNTDGDTLWTKTFGGTGNDHGYSVQQTTDGGYIITGHTYSFGAGLADVYIIKTDVNGNTSWTKTFGGMNNDLGRTVQQTSDGGYIFIGSTSSFGAGDTEVYLIKTNSNGDTSWTKTFGETDCDYYTNSIQQTTDGGYIIAGGTGSIPGYYDVYLMKTNTNGDTLWTKTFGGTDITKEDMGYSVEQTTDGGYIIAGYTESFGAGNGDVYLIKTNANGGVLWTKTFGGVEVDCGHSVHQTNDGGYIIAGNKEVSSRSHVYLIKTNANGYVSVNETTIEQNSYMIFPNPATDIIEISIPEKSQIEILNIEGQTIKNITTNEGTTGIDISDFAKGIYFVKLISEEEICIKKFIKE